jgi:hypothetical protein
MTGVCNLRKNFVTWIKAGAVIGFVMAAVLATMILAVSNSAQSGQVKAYRSERLDQKAVERQLPWDGSHLALLF